MSGLISIVTASISGLSLFFGGDDNDKRRPVRKCPKFCRPTVATLFIPTGGLNPTLTVPITLLGRIPDCSSDESLCGCLISGVLRNGDVVYQLTPTPVTTPETLIPVVTTALTSCASLLPGATADLVIQCPDGCCTRFNPVAVACISPPVA